MERSAAGTSLPEQPGCVQSPQTQPPSLKTRELENERLVQEKKKPFHYCKGHNHPYAKTISKLNSQLPFRTECLMQPNLHCFVLVIWVYLYVQFRTIWFLCSDFEKACFSFDIVVTVLTLRHKKPKICPKVLLIKLLISNTADQIASLRFREKASLPTKIWKEAYKWSKYQ